MAEFLSKQLKVRRQLVLRLVVLGVAFNGLLIIASTLVTELAIERPLLDRLDFLVHVPLIIGLTLLYLSSLLVRRKRLALIITMVVYGFVLGISALRLVPVGHHHLHLSLLYLTTDWFVPLLVLVGLIATHAEFTVKSDTRSFAVSLRFIVLVMLIAFVYGVLGFQLLDDRQGFHQEINAVQAIHYTIDQFNITTSHPLVPHTRQARLFLDSLSVISAGALGYAAISLFQPIRARLSSQTTARTAMRRLLESYPATSEDFFKLWPHDKDYFMNKAKTAGLAYRVTHGVALVVGDPAGDPKAFGKLWRDFDELCRVNDWQPAAIHTEPAFRKLYERRGLIVQKIGEEAVLDLDHFQSQVAGNKYFRHIRNKFTKTGFTTEVLNPPHSQAVLSRLIEISHDWLGQPGRVERGFMMGYFSIAYLEQCPLVVVRDHAGQIQAFLNQIPSYDKTEANFDLLRHGAGSPGNINDFLLMGFINSLADQGFTRLNLGFSPLAGMHEKSENMTLIDSAMRFAYANGDRLYSFSGLWRFKNKYEPKWEDRYIAYRGGLRGFTKVLNSVNQAMKVRRVPLG